MGSSAAASRTVLIVDDERVVALELRTALQARGFYVPPTAADGLHAIEIAETHPPDVVLMGVRLRGHVDGIDTAIMLRARFDFGLVYMTGGVDAAARARAEATAPAAWVYKPYAMAHIEAALQLANRRRCATFTRWATENTVRLAEAYSLIARAPDAALPVGLRRSESRAVAVSTLSR